MSLSRASEKYGINAPCETNSSFSGFNMITSTPQEKKTDMVHQPNVFKALLPTSPQLQHWEGIAGLTTKMWALSSIFLHPPFGITIPPLHTEQNTLLLLHIFYISEVKTFRQYTLHGLIRVLFNLCSPSLRYTKNMFRWARLVCCVSRRALPLLGPPMC